MKSKSTLTRLLLAAACVFAASCGSSGGGNVNQGQNQNDTNWDELVWNQDDWS